jgi:O-6-methylguanine DNA methyltransferase
METPLGFIRAKFQGKTLARLEISDTPSESLPLLLQTELKAYFSGKLKRFKTPIQFVGTPFQMRVWQELENIPYGETRSYMEIAEAIGKPTAFRAVAQAIGANPLLLIVPCHRVINADGKLGGFSAGIHRKQWLLSHEMFWQP